MFYSPYESPVGPLTLASDGTALTGLSFGTTAAPKTALPLFEEAFAWLDTYFSGRDPGPAPALNPAGTAFQRRVWQALGEIPYGQTATYGQLADKLGSSPRAVGGAVGRNPLSLLIPCHRVVGAGGSRTGYAGGIERKKALLTLEAKGERA